ncbi:hypothetical protein [Gemmobacter fulvus]|uniref:hypothetical protein n=2 Tax=Gemmobacter fulvus TaxID=2840474 RepID=UPI003531433C
MVYNMRLTVRGCKPSQCRIPLRGKCAARPVPMWGRPLTPALQEALGMGDRRLTTGAVCVYHRFVATAVEAPTGAL